MVELERFLITPDPIWDFKSTRSLVSLKWLALKSVLSLTPSTYNTAGVLHKTENSLINRIEIIKTDNRPPIFIEDKSELLSQFYSQNDLNVLSREDFLKEETVSKVKLALNLFKHVPSLHESIFELVRSIQIVRQPDADVDISHSDPQIPFSIFISICRDKSEISNLRVAESILHEAMHLKLTLLESVFPIVEENNSETYYSPWRNKQRPLRGVFHGIFVFRAIYDFFTLLQEGDHIVSIKYIEKRKREISEEFHHLKDFHLCNGLTTEGVNLITSLLPLN